MLTPVLHPAGPCLLPTLRAKAECKPFIWNGFNRSAGECVFIPGNGFGNSLPICSLQADLDFGDESTDPTGTPAFFQDQPRNVGPGSTSGWDYCNPNCGKWPTPTSFELSNVTLILHPFLFPPLQCPRLQTASRMTERLLMLPATKRLLTAAP